MSLSHNRTHNLSSLWIYIPLMLCFAVSAAVKEQKLANYFGRKVAIDASMTIYQFAVTAP